MTQLLLVVGILVLIPLGLMMCTFVARDMDRRGLDGRIYGALTFFFAPLGLAVWLFKRLTTPVVDEGA
jgi:hypothetical protein